MKINVGSKDGKTYKIELADDKAGVLYGKAIGDEVEGDLIGLPGYVLEIRGGSDKSGFPMRKDIGGTGKKSILIGSGPGIRKAKHGLRLRKTVRGNTVSSEISQLNVIVKKEGSAKLEDLLGKKEEGDSNNAA